MSNGRLDDKTNVSFGGLSELIPMLFNTGLTNLGSEASVSNIIGVNSLVDVYLNVDVKLFLMTCILNKTILFY